MVRGLYLTATNMIVMRRRLDMISNNVANVETIGYKSENLVSRSFRDMLINRIDDGYTDEITDNLGPMNTGVHVEEVITQFTQGPLRETAKSTDAALVGDGFFAINTPAGIRYTRDGSFFVDSDGALKTAAGYDVLDVNGQGIVPGSDEFVIDAAGNVTVGDEYLTRLQIVSFADNQLLRRVGGNLFDTNGQIPQAAVDMEIKQGFLEGSNVEVSNEIVDAMAVYRSYETSQRFVRMIDETLQKTVNEIGRV